MKPFFVSTLKFGKDGLPIFNVKGLTLSQKRFVEGCKKSWKESLKVGDLPKDRRRISVIYWLNEEDFVGLLHDVRDDVDPEVAIIEYEAMYDNALDLLYAPD